MFEKRNGNEIDRYKANPARKSSDMWVGAALSVVMVILEITSLVWYNQKISEIAWGYFHNVVIILFNLGIVMAIMRSRARYVAIGMFIMFGITVLIFGGCAYL